MRIIYYVPSQMLSRGWHPPDPGVYVKAGAALATWVVIKTWINQEDHNLAVVLDAVEPHEVPLNAPLYELPKAVAAEVVPLKHLMEQAGMGVLADVVGGMDRDLPRVWI